MRVNLIIRRSDHSESGSGTIPLSLTIRLFANMFAGEKVTAAFLALTYFILPAAFMGLHVFVSLLQAYIFALLAMIYVGGAVAHEH